MLFCTLITGICNIPKIFKKTLHCSGKITHHSTEDRGNYTVAWKPLNKMYTRPSPWTYASTKNTLELFGKI